jgi:hypothetical protein
MVLELKQCWLLVLQLHQGQVEPYACGVEVHFNTCPTIMLSDAFSSSGVCMLVNPVSSNTNRAICFLCCCPACALLLQAEAERLQGQHSLLSVMLNINSVLTDGAASMVDDSFLKCFVNATPDPWNWNFYLAPLWWVRGVGG